MLCGHMHEYQGKQKLGKTLVVNAGDASEGRGVIVEIEEKNKKMNNVKFIR